MVQAAGAALVVSAAVSILVVSGSAYALPQANNSVLCVGSCTAGTPYSSGQQVEVTLPASSFPPGDVGQHVNIVECAAPGGTVPTDPATCDGLTIQGDTILIGSDGSVDYDNYNVYALPDPDIGDTGTTPKCDLSNECVLYVGLDQNDFTKDGFFTEGFFVNPDSTAPPGDGSQATVGATDPDRSTITATPATAVADGTDQVTATVTLLDSKGQAEPSHTVSVGQGAGHASIPTSATTNSSGVATFTLTDTSAEQVSLSATDGTDSVTVTQRAPVTFVAPTVSAAHSSVTASPGSVPADGSTASTITVTLRDQAVNPDPVSGRTVAVTQGSGTHATITAVSAVTDSSGVATFSATDAADEAVIFSATDTTDETSVTQTAGVTFGTLSVSADASTVMADAPIAQVGAGAGAGTQVTVTLESSAHSPIGGKEVTLSPSTGTAAQVAPTSATTDGQGKVNFTVTDASAEPVTFSATDITDALDITQTVAVQFEVAAPSATTSKITPAISSDTADGSTPADLSVSVDDQFGNGLPGKTVTLQVSDASGNAAAIPVTVGGGTPGVTTAQGTAIFQVRDTTAEVVTATATDTTDGVTLANSATITFTPGAPDPAVSTIGANPSNVPSDGTTASTVTVTIDDHFGNPVASQTISLAAASGASTITPLKPTTGIDGKATFSVTDATSEVVTYTATDTTFGNTPLSDDGVAVTFGTQPPPVPAIADSVLVAGAKSAPADGQSSVTITVLLYDDNGDPVMGKEVSLNPSGGSSTMTTVSGTSDENGQASFTVTDKTAETVTYDATDVTDSLPITGQSVVVQFTPSTGATSSSATSSTGSTSAATSASGTGGSSVGGSGTSGSDDGGSDASTAAQGSVESGATLALTGTPSLLPWLLALGIVMLVAGSAGRRVSQPVPGVRT